MAYIRGKTSELLKRSGFEFLLCYLLPTWPQTSYLTMLDLGFRSVKRDQTWIIILNIEAGLGNREVGYGEAVIWQIFRVDWKCICIY